MSTLRSTWHKTKFDKPFFWISVAIIIIGLFIFFSAALSVLSSNPAQFYRMLISQLVLGLCGGIVVGFFLFRVPYTFWQKYALHFFIGSLLITALVFVPGLAQKHGGAIRWLNIGPFSFQPSELLKLTSILYIAAWYSWASTKINLKKLGIIPLGIICAIAGMLLLPQPDTDTLIVIVCAGTIIYFVSGMRARDILILLVIAIIGSTALLSTQTYLQERMKTFLNPSSDMLDTSWQLTQGFIAIGSGRLYGRGYGHSIQKFKYLPEATNDSIFAVVGEETGFIGSVFLIVLYLAFAFRGFYIARRSPTMFTRLIVVGLVSLVIVQSFLNIAAIVGVFPFSGLPLIFVSHGGTSLLFSIVIVALILHISQYMQRVSVLNQSQE
ncbi:hypothetical protein A2997_00740 [Candidatus Nomurabacteria bacterium RIFCSPLOWO2_01_FULL_36_10b]|uniref:Probable peptidoglycan glycosyltransferase FtsW n=1 Tax=Candidatus Nomurabacteria bacterium RIFCSPLOWO2_01_FULL_36_10b TaxID=1801766 RepID=A0A1F6WNP8_9BACT|nr:MAG: hypothetical protein A2997_00740 [Candidatus Nomurabacteria bacterium RIFCSPLOWO2_01_FULL_36_10b]